MKVGDWVRVINPEERPDGPDGLTGIIVEIDVRVLVRFPNWEMGHNGDYNTPIAPAGNVEHWFCEHEDIILDESYNVKLINTKYENN